MAQYLLTLTPHIETSAPGALRSRRLFLIEGALDGEAARRLTDALLVDPVVQRAEAEPLDQLSALREAASQVLEVAYRPGVTDSEAESVLLGARRLGLPGLRQVRTLRRWLLPDATSSNTGFFNPLIQTTLSYRPADDAAPRVAFYRSLLAEPDEAAPTVASVPLRALDDAGLLELSRRGVLALDLEEMRAIRAYYQQAGRDPTDAELETLAQTWSEHCSHKTFKARVSYRTRGRPPGGHGRGALDARLHSAYHLLDGNCEIDSLIKTFLMRATDEVLEARRARGEPPWVLSAFVDNAGIVAFGADYELSFKVETHNHPSALEPFGGANTGVGGVVRDVLGVSAQPIANTDVLCFGPLDTPDEALPEGVLTPRRTYAGVVAGVRDYGNKLGIPTVNGAVLFDPGYLANPLVFCGTVGLAPRGAHPRALAAGDAIVVVGGRTGRDGIHGATFSSEELTHTTASEVGSAVQIGDPITEKKLLDVIVQARDRRLYSAITDCGAGGLSSAVGEMGAELGARVDLTLAPRKYAGLLPWEIWLSEAQERMVLAVPQASLAAFLALCAAEDVEARAIGTFEATGALAVRHGELPVIELGMGFLHDGRPQRALEASWVPRADLSAEDLRLAAEETRLEETLLALLAHPNIASKASIIRSYDHEVRGATVIKPLVGATMDGPGDAAVLRPLGDRWQGLALGCGVNVRYGRIDPYWMALACVDEALRNVVAVGGDPGQTAILDNFCWGDPRRSDRMAGLTRAAAGCYDAARAFGTPFISGKDSLNNEYRGADGTRTPIPPTLVISALAIVPDVRRALTMDLKEPGNYVYLLGTTRAELGGSHYLALRGRLGSSLPQVDLAQAPRLLDALHRAIRAGLVRACHDMSEGGLAVAAAEMAFAGGWGIELELERAASDGELPDAALLFGESPTRLLVEVEPAHAAAFERQLAGAAWARVGRVTEAQELLLRRGERVLIRSSLAALKAAWEATLAGEPISPLG
jgi:phosphoribosylformylglycinamidine synthase subunit PurSL